MTPGMVIQINHRQLQTLAQLQALLDETTAMDFAVATEERYGSIGRPPCSVLPMGKARRQREGYRRQVLTKTRPWRSRSAPAALRRPITDPATCGPIACTRRSRRLERHLPQHCGRLRHTVRGRGDLRADQRGVLNPGSGGNTAQLPLHHPQLSQR
jgi:hypothetical protein